MRRREEDARPPIEVLGSDLGLSSTQQVTRGPRGPSPRRGRALVGLFALVAVLVLGLSLGGADDDAERATPEEERDNRDRTDLDKPLTSTTARRTTTTRPTTTTTRPPIGPVFGSPMAGALLIGRGGSWVRYDLMTGEATEVDLPQADSFSAVSMPGGLVIPVQGEARFYPLDGAGSSGDPEYVALGPADRAVSAGPDRVWLFDQPPHGSTASVSQARLVALDGRELRSFEVPGAYAWWATADAVLVGRGGRVYAADERGLRALGVGWLMGATTDGALLTACDDDGDCSLRLVSPTTGSSRPLVDIPDPDAVYYEVAPAPDGRIALLEREQNGVQVRTLLFDADGSPLGELDTGAIVELLPQWLPGDLGLVVNARGGLAWARPRASGWELQDLGLPETAESFFIVTP